MKTEHINNIVSLVAEATKDALNGNQVAVASAIKHINNVELYGELPMEVKRHISFILTNMLF